MGKWDDLERLQKLKECGAITEAEFEIEKKKILADDIKGVNDNHEIKDDIADLPIYMSDDIESFTVESTTFHETINSLAYFQVLGDEQSIRIREDSLSSIYHEIGHFVDYNCTGFDNEELEELVALEGETLITEFNLYTDYFLEPREFFAESFSHYVTAPERMAKVMPVTYNFIEQVMNWYE